MPHEWQSFQTTNYVFISEEKALGNLSGKANYDTNNNVDDNESNTTTNSVTYVNKIIKL